MVFDLDSLVVVTNKNEALLNTKYKRTPKSFCKSDAARLQVFKFPTRDLYKEDNITSVFDYTAARSTYCLYRETTIAQMKSGITKKCLSNF